MPTNDAIPGTPDMLAGWRLKIGIALISLMVLLWLLIPIGAAFKVSGGAIATTTAVIAITNMFVFVIAVVAMGKPGFAFLKTALFHKHAPPVEVGPTRYRIGLVMFFTPLVQGLIETWSSHLSPQLLGHQLWIDVLMNGMFVASMCVLGGDFWDKLRALFSVDARAIFPEEVGTTAPAMTVSSTRYTIGLAMFCLPFLQGLLETYSAHLAPQLVERQLWVEVLRNGVFVASVFVLGGEFWDKVRAIFVDGARAIFPEDSNGAAVAPLGR